MPELLEGAPAPVFAADSVGGLAALGGSRRQKRQVPVYLPGADWLYYPLLSLGNLDQNCDGIWFR